MSDTRQVDSVELIKLAEDLLSHQQSISFRVIGTSMTPFFRHQHTIVTLHKVTQPLRKHDVVLFWYNQKPILHRIIRIQDSVIFCRGDALFEMEKIQLTNVIGIVTRYEYKNRQTVTTNRWYRFQVQCWSLTYPIRWILHRLRRLFK